MWSSKWLLDQLLYKRGFETVSHLFFSANAVPFSGHYNNCPGSFTGTDWVNCADIFSSISVRFQAVLGTQLIKVRAVLYSLDVLEKMTKVEAVLLWSWSEKLSQVLKLFGNSLLMILSCSRTAVWCSQAALSPPDSSSRTFNPRGARVLGTQDTITIILKI